MQKMTQAIQNPTSFKSRPAANDEKEASKRGWRDRLEQMKAKKIADKEAKKAEATAKVVQPTEEDELRSAFTTQGIKRTEDGDI